MLAALWQLPLGYLTAGMDYARAVLSGVHTTLAQLIVQYTVPPSPIRTVDTVLDAIYSLELDDTIPGDWVQQLSLDRLWLSEHLRNPEFTYFLCQETYKRYRHGGMPQDLLAAVFLARETLQVFGAEPPSSFHLPSAPPDRHSRAINSGNEPDLKAKAAIVYADLTGCLFEREKNPRNYAIAIRSAVYAVRESASASVKALALDVLSNIYELKWQKDHILGDLSDSIEASKSALELCARDNEHWPVIADNYAGHLELRFSQTHDRDDIGAAIALSTQVYKQAARDYDRARTAANLGAKFQARARQSATPRVEREQDFDRSVDFARIAFQLTPPGHPERWLRLRNLSAAVFARGKFRHHHQDLVDAIFHAREALAAVPPLSAVRERLIIHLADVLELHYTETGDPSMRDLDEINECIRWTREVKILYQHEDHRGDSVYQIRRWNSILSLLSRRIFLKYEQTQDPEDAGEAMRLAELMLDKDGSPLGSNARFQWPPPGRAGEGAEPGPAVDDDEHDGRLDMMTGVRGGEFHEAECAEEGGGRCGPFDPLQPAFRHHPHDDSYLGDPLLLPSEKIPPNAGYGYWLENLPHRTGAEARRGAHSTVAFFAGLATLWRRILGRRGGRLDMLCGATDYVFDRARADRADAGKWYAEQTRDLLRYLVDSIETEDHVNTIWGWIYNSPDASRAPLLRLFASQLARYGSNKPSPESVTELRILALKKAVQLSPSGTEPLLRARCLADLADAYSAAFSLTGTQEYFETARGHAREATRLGFVGSAINRDPKVCLPLIALLLDRYWLAGFLDDMQQSIQLVTESALSLNSADETFADALQILAVALQERSSRTKARLDLEEALLFARTALSSGRLSKRLLVTLLNVIAAIYAAQYQTGKEVDILDRQIQAGEMACRVVDRGDTQIRLAFHNLSLGFRARFQNAREKSSHTSVFDIERAVATEILAIAFSASRVVNRARLWMSLGNTYMARYDAFGVQRDRADAVRAYLQAARVANAGSPLVRITALTTAARLQASMDRPADALTSFERAIELFATLSARGMSHDNKQSLLSDVGGVPSDAAAAALLLLGTSGDGPLWAVKLLEQGRGLIIGTIIEERSEARQLLRIDPVLHRRFRDLQLRLAARREHEPSRRVLAYYDSANGHQPLAAEEEDLDAEMERLLGQIRDLDGMSHFFLAPSREELQDVSKEGAVIMVFNSAVFTKSFAIISTRGYTKAVELPEITTETIQRNLDVLRRVRKLAHEQYFKRGRRLIPVLEWLWTAAVKPILHSMGWRAHAGDSSHLVSHSVKDLPRVWWIGVGLLAHFPFHAAGCYGGDTPGESAMDVVNSTYVPTLKSLLYAREKRAALADTAHAKVCFVAMETTPGYPRLDGVENEAQLIQAAFPGDCVSRITPVTTLVHPTAAQVADHIGHCDVLHLACHAESDLTNPSRSRLILARTDPDGRGMDRPDELFVEDIMRRSSSAGAAAGIAFLRACYSADNPAVGLSDEAIHLASAFHLAGFNHVLATLWSTRNDSCRAVAEKFYTYLFQGAQEPTHRSVAVAFHRAVNDLREDSWTNPLLWASFVHVGA